MVTHANVMLWGQTVGLVIWDDRLHRAQFQYDRDFVNGNLNVVLVMMLFLKVKGGDAVLPSGTCVMTRSKVCRGCSQIVFRTALEISY